MKTAFFDLDNWKEIGVTLARNKTRTFLTAFGIFWGTAMLAMLLGGSKGLEDLMARNFEGFATNSALIFPNRTTISYKGYNKGTAWSITSEEVEAMRRVIPEIRYLTATDYVTASAVNGKKAKSVTVSGVDQYFHNVFEPVIYEGRFVNAADDFHQRKVCVIGKQVSLDLFGQESPIGKYVQVAGIYYRIVGMAGQTSEVTIQDKIDESIIIPASTLRKAFNRGNNVGGLMLVARDGISPSSLRPRIERVFRNNHPISPEDHKAMFFFDVSERFAMVDNLFTGIRILALFVGMGTLLAGIIGVGNIMWVIVKERTKEIGIRRAIGARPSDIITQILSEGVALTTLAGVAGIVFATLVLFVAQKLTDNGVSQAGFQLMFSQAAAIMVTFIVLGTAAGLIPSVKAMKIKPIEAMNDK